MTSVSVIVPVYKVEEYIAQCARSLFEQTYPHIQFIFIDDGTPDRSMDVLRGVVDEYPGVADRILLLSQQNSGQAKARFNGLAHATGDYIQFVDADDYLETDAIASMVGMADATQADMVYFDFWKERGNRRKLDRPKEYGPGDQLRFMKDLYTYRNYAYMWNKFARRGLYVDLFVPSHSMHEDIVLVNQLVFKTSSMAFLDKPLYHYRRDNRNSTTRLAMKVRRVQAANNYLDYYEHFRDNIAGSPVEHFVDELILRPAWIAFTLDHSLFDQRPYLAKAALGIPLGTGRKINLFQQLLLRTYLRLR